MPRYDSNHSPTTRQKPRPEAPTVPQCSVEMKLLRCTLPAVWHEYREAEGYCWVHMEASSRIPGLKLHDQLQDIRDNRGRYLAERLTEDWRSAMVAHVIEGHPEWLREEGEPLDDYKARMMKQAKGLGYVETP